MSGLMQLKQFLLKRYPLLRTVCTCPVLVSSSRDVFLHSSPWLAGGVGLSECMSLPAFLHLSVWLVSSGSPSVCLYLSPFICLPTHLSHSLAGAGLLCPSHWMPIFTCLPVHVSQSCCLCPALSMFVFTCLLSFGWWCPALWMLGFLVSFRRDENRPHSGIGRGKRTLADLAQPEAG